MILELRTRVLQSLNFVKTPGDRFCEIATSEIVPDVFYTCGIDLHEREEYVAACSIIDSDREAITKASNLNVHGVRRQLDTGLAIVV